jgi:hypothetical protein
MYALPSSFTFNLLTPTPNYIYNGYVPILLFVLSCPISVDVKKVENISLELFANGWASTSISIYLYQIFYYVLIIDISLDH